MVKFLQLGDGADWKKGCCYINLEGMSSMEKAS